MATEWHHMADITHDTFMLAALLCIRDLITYFRFSFHAYVSSVCLCVSELECITVMTLIMLIAISSVSVAAVNVNSAVLHCLFYVNLLAYRSPGYWCN